MKRYLFLLLTFFTLHSSFFTLYAQTVGEAFYIYRNDGQFNAFFRDEVDSIAYSHYDADSVYYDENVTQLVYTADSLYRIPLAAIDSVSFVQPETILQPNVVMMDKVGLMDYLQAVDGMSLFFKPVIPHEMRPVVGQVIVSTDFNSPLLSNGFAGKVLSATMTSDAFRVDCDSIYDIFEIFEQLVSIEEIEDESAASRREAGGEWISNKNSLNFNLGYKHPLSDGEVSLSGSVDGTYVATLIYNITRKEQYFNLRIDHDWQYCAHCNFKSEKSFGTLMGPVVSLPAIRFPAVAPVFKFQIAGVPFVKGEGNMEIDFSLNSPVHSYVAQAIYHNGHFRGWNHKKPVQGSNNPSFETAFSLNGSIQFGYMVDLWLGLDIFGSVFKMGTGLDFYIGPQLSGDFTMKFGTDNPVNYYSIYKDCKVGVDWLHVDYEFFGEAALAGHKFPEAVFCDGSLQSPFNYERYIMPEFSCLNIDKDTEHCQATISTTPSRDIFFPLSLGIGLYDNENNLIGKKYESMNYKRANEGYEVKQTFASLEQGKEYTAKPFIKILGGEVPALPIETFKLEGETTCPDANHPHMIDLGLPSGTKWACCNVGASAPEQYGNYYAWGETQPKSVYNWSTYRWGSDNDELTKYCTKSSYGPVDNKTTLDASDDAATANWGAPWRMPSLTQIDELLYKATSIWTTQNGVTGRKFTGPNGGTIFLPAAGVRWNGGLGDAGSSGNYWSATLNEYNPYGAYELYLYSKYPGRGSSYHRYGGYSVRPVR